jgi:hypothetical protein
MKMKKMTLWVAGMVSLVSASAFADGFRCQTENGDVRVIVYNNTHAEHGTRNGAAMVFSDPLVQYGRKTIARFSDVKGTLWNTGAHYEANVDLRFKDSSRKGEYIGGTRLGYLDAIELNVDFNYAQPVRTGEYLSGKLLLIKRNGKQIEHNLDCIRYLKSEE